MEEKIINLIKNMKLLLILGVLLIIAGVSIYWLNYKHNKAKARIGLLIEFVGLTIAFGKPLCLFVYHHLGQ